MAIKKVRLTLEPTGTAQALADLAATEDEWHWPAAWAAIQGATAEAMAQITEETDELRALCETLEAADGVFAELDVDVDVDEDVFVCGKFEIDLRGVIEGDEGPAAAAALVRLLDVTSRSVGYHADVMIGGKRMDLDAAGRALALELASRGVPLETQEAPTVVFGSDAKGGAASSTPPAPPPKPPRPTGKKPRNTESKGGFGGLDEDAATREQPRSRSAEPLFDGFTHEEHFFIHQTRITWPVAGDQLLLLRKRVLTDSHPDRFAAAGDDARHAAHERFVWLSTGVERLLARLGVRGG